MLHDLQDQVSVAQAFTATAVSTNAIDMFTASSDFTIGRRMAMLAVPTVAAGAGSTHVLAVVQADDAALTTNVEVLGSITVLAAALTVGSYHEIPIPQGVKTRRYIGFRDTISGGATTVTLDVFLVPQDEINKYKSFTKVVHADNN